MRAPLPGPSVAVPSLLAIFLRLLSEISVVGCELLIRVYLLVSIMAEMLAAQSAFSCKWAWLQQLSVLAGISHPRIRTALCFGLRGRCQLRTCESDTVFEKGGHTCSDSMRKERREKGDREGERRRRVYARRETLLICIISEILSQGLVVGVSLLFRDI